MKQRTAAAYTTTQVAELTRGLPPHDGAQLELPLEPAGLAPAALALEETPDLLRRAQPTKPSGTARAAMDPSHRSLALSLGAVDEALDRATCARLAAAARKLASALDALASAPAQNLSTGCQLLALLHDATLPPEIEQP